MLYDILIGKALGAPCSSISSSTMHASFLSDNQVISSWLLDSRAIYHLTNNANNLEHGTSYSSSHSITIGDGNSVLVKQIGQSYVSTHLGSHLVL